MPTLAMEVVERLNKQGIYDESKYIEEFIKYLTIKIEEAKDMLIERFDYICSQPMESAKFMYENNVMAGFDGKNIKSALKHGTLALGQIGLAETLQILIKTDHTTDKGMELAKKIESLFRTKCDEYKQQYKLNFGVYYTPKHFRLGVAQVIV